jgi:hypothetical protein
MATHELQIILDIDVLASGVEVVTNDIYIKGIAEKRLGRKTRARRRQSVLTANWQLSEIGACKV